MKKINIKEGQKVWFISDTHFNHTNICRSTTTWKDANDITRDFKSLSHMNETLINNINEKVGEDDLLFHLGDWSFGGVEQIWEFRKRIFCKNIHLILGNHDHHIDNDAFLPNVHSDYNGNLIDGENPNTFGDGRDRMFDVNAMQLFDFVRDYAKIEFVFPQIDKTKKAVRKSFILSHYPICSWHDMNNGNIHLFGHVHLPPKHKLREGKAMDVGCDGNNLYPIEINEVLKIMKDQPIKKTTLPRDHHEKRV